MFVLACTALLLLAMTNHVKALCIGDFQSSIRTFLWLAAPLLMAAPVITTFYDAYRFNSGAEVGPSQGVLVVSLSLIGALLIVASALYGLVQPLMLKKQIRFWPMGALVLSTVLGGVGVMATIKQLSFVDENSGMLNFGFFRESVTDMKCGSDLILAKFIEGQPAKYRCPKGFIMNQFSGAPFVPWPDYIEGESAELGAVISQYKNSFVDLEEKE